jgi:uncharacterized protein YegL
MKNKTRIICIIDRSGSMSSIKNDAIGGFNSFLKEQQKIKDKSRMKVILFDHEYQVLSDGKLKNIKEFDESNYIPRGTTALYDAIGKTINSEIEENIKREKKYKKFIVVILTDGQENSSKEYDLDSINKIIKDREKSGWEFMFLAANQDSFKSAFKMGIRGNAVFDYQPSKDGTRQAYFTMSSNVTNFRKSSSKDQYEKRLKKIKQESKKTKI